MNLLDMLKSANIFSPTGMTNPQQFPVGSIGGPDIPQPAVPQGNPPGLDLSAAIQGLLSPRDEQFNNFSQMIQSMPQRSQYPPDLLHKLGGVLAGLGTGGPVGIDKGAVLGYRSNIPEGLKVQGAIKDEKYNEALNDWANQLGPTEKIAQMEQSRNVGNRATALGTLQRQQAQEKIDAAEAQNKVKNEQNQQNIDIRKERADSYVKAKQFAMDHPNYKPFVDADGNLVLYNPQDPTSEPVETGVKKLSEMEKIDLGVQGELKKISARSEASKGLEGAKQANRKEMEGVRQINRLGLKETPSGNATVSKLGKPLTPSATAVERQNKIIDIINERPELSKYFVYGGNKKPTGEIQEPPNADPKEMDFIRGQMGGHDVSLPSTITQQPTRELTRPSAKPPITIYESDILKQARKDLKPGYVLVTKDGGRTVQQMKAENIQSKLFTDSGYVVIK